MSEAITVRGVRALTRRLARTDPRARRAVKLAINDTLRKLRTRGSRAIREQVNLKAGYVNERLNVSLASEDNLEGRVVARRRATLLTRYGAKQLTRKAPGAKGDPSRGIPAGRAQAGISVKVKRGGSRKKMRGAFFVRLKAGRERGAGALGVVLRTGEGRDAYRTTYGPSVDQVWRDVRDDLQPWYEAALRAELRRQLGRLL